MRLSEVYASVQGEGPRVGLPTAFVRFAGCNLRCPLWPCDTPYAIDPKKYRSEWRNIDASDLLDEILPLPVANVCLTGGEPWLQPKDELLTLVEALLVEGYTIECFSNGTLPIPDWAFASVNFVFDWKLSGSGETDFNVAVFENNLHRGASHAAVALKFTVASRVDFEQAYIRSLGVAANVPVYVGPVWGKCEPADIVDWMQTFQVVNWRLNIQAHKYIFDPKARGV